MLKLLSDINIHLSGDDILRYLGIAFIVVLVIALIIFIIGRFMHWTGLGD